MRARTNWALGTLMLAIAFALTACLDTTAPDLADVMAPSYAKGGGHGGGPRSGGSSGPTAGNVITTLADAPGDRVLSDGGPYATINKKQEVTSEITTDGRQSLDINPGPANRELCVKFPPAGPDAIIVSQGDWDDLTASGEVALGSTYCSGDVTWHSRDHSEDGKFLGMDTTPGADPDDIQTSGGKLVLEGLGTGDWEWRLFFDDYRTPINGGDRVDGLCIRYNDDGTWTVGPDPTIDDTSEAPGTCDAVDEWLNLIRAQTIDGAAVFTFVARFRMPFRFTVTPE